MWYAGGLEIVKRLPECQITHHKLDPIVAAREEKRVMLLDDLREC